jgi:transcription elongation factor GreA
MQVLSLDKGCYFRYNTEIVKEHPGETSFCAKVPKCDLFSRILGFVKELSIMEEKKNLLTYAGLKKLEDELHDLKVVKRKEVAQKIKEAREQGDLSENAEYDAAKDEQRDIEARIEEIEKILKNAEVVVEDEVDLDKISVGCKVKVHDYEFDEDIEFKIVGSTEANSLEGKISNESPVGKALIGAATGDVVKVEMPSGIMEYKVLEIQRNV